MPLEGHWEDPRPALDEATCEALADALLTILDDGAAAVVKAVALRETADAALADAASSSARMTDGVKKTVRLGAIQCAKKYAVDLHYAPELMFFGGLVVWAGQNALTIRQLKAKGRELRQ